MLAHQSPWCRSPRCSSPEASPARDRGGCAPRCGLASAWRMPDLRGAVLYTDVQIGDRRSTPPAGGRNWRKAVSVLLPLPPLRLVTLKQQPSGHRGRVDQGPCRRRRGCFHVQAAMPNRQTCGLSTGVSQVLDPIDTPPNPTKRQDDQNC